MKRIRIGNAPVSFGVFEASFGNTKQMRWQHVLDAIKEAGYEGTELGPYGYLPTEPEVLDRELKARGLSLASSFVPVRLSDPNARKDGVDECLKVGRLLATQGVKEVIVADAGDENRVRMAGMNPLGWNEEEWRVAITNLEAIADALSNELGMKVVVHHHAGTYIETPSECQHLLEMTEKVDLLLDTGHYVYGGGDPVDAVQRFGNRIRYVHFKDVDPSKLEWIRNTKIDMKTAWRKGVFVPLGRGCVDFARILDGLYKLDYQGWIIVEQDVVADQDGKLSPDPFECAKESREFLKGLGL